MKKILRSIKNEWNEYNDGEILVRELTKNDNHPPNPQSLQRLNELAKDIYSSPSIYQMLNKRLHDLNYLMHIEKSLIVIEYLLKNCDTRFVRFMKMQTDYIKRLRGLKYMVAINEFEKVDKAEIVRRRANRLYSLLTDDEELEKQRCKSQGKPYVPKTKVNSNKPSVDTMSPNDVTQQNENKKQPQQQKIKNKDDKSPQSTENITSDASNHKHSKRKNENSNNNNNNNNNNKNNNNNNNNNDDLFADFIDIGTSNHTSKQGSISNNNDIEDLLPEDWFKEFANMPNSGVGQDGTAMFSFDNNDDFGLDSHPFRNDNSQNNEDNDNNQNNDNNSEKKNHQVQDSEEWLTQLTNLDNLLNSPKQEKKPKSQGKTLAQMAQESGNHRDNTFVNPTIQPSNAYYPYTTFMPSSTVVPTYIPQTSMNNVLLNQPILTPQPYSLSNQQKTVSNNNNNKPQNDNPFFM